jgi:hypothetical protein
MILIDICHVLYTVIYMSIQQTILPCIIYMYMNIRLGHLTINLIKIIVYYIRLHTNF